MRSALINVGLDIDVGLEAKSVHVLLNLDSELSAGLLSTSSPRVHIESGMLRKTHLMRVEDCILEILIVPPEGAAHASYSSIDSWSSPTSVATD